MASEIRPEMVATIDHNLIIDLESGNGEIPTALRQLVKRHDDHEITIRVSAIGASERIREKQYAPTFLAFQERVCKLSQRSFELLKPIGYWGITYYDWCLWVNENGPESKLEQKIHEILFFKINYKWQDYAQSHGVDSAKASDNGSHEWQAWRNRKCDVLTYWCHVYYQGDIFISSDRAFHQATKKLSLMNLGKKNLHPIEAAALFVAKV